MTIIQKLQTIFVEYGLHPIDEEYDDALVDFPDWSGPCGLGKRG
jgi:hypothetical protein